jgi:AraC-type DNA-binding domain-containing proteins
MRVSLKKADLEKMFQAKAILDKEYRRHYTHHQLALMLNTNEYKLKHGFKQTFHVTLYEYLTRMRIQKAKDLLAYTDYPVSRVAAEVGFPNASNFSKRFIQCTGVLPLEYRNQQSNTPDFTIFYPDLPVCRCNLRVSCLPLKYMSH